ncbi:hypothetical protein CSV69_10855 [Sporosarcina sp. P26b]|nr:hypothetical protein CSV69_10855 [Sporosarcina sp. P26b]
MPVPLTLLVKPLPLQKQGRVKGSQNHNLKPYPTYSYEHLPHVFEKRIPELPYTPSTTAEVEPMPAPLTLLVKPLPMQKQGREKGSQKHNLTSYPTYFSNKLSIGSKNNNLP